MDNFNQNLYLTILLPVYNGEKYIADSIKSVLMQSYEYFELLIIDDGSTDRTAEIVRSFSDSRIRYLKIENRGLAGALNFGLENAKFDWVARTDADDLCHSDRIREQIAYIDEDESKIIVSRSCYFNNSKILFNIDTPTDDKELKKSFTLYSPFAHTSVIYNRNFILSAGGYNAKFRVFEDYELWMRVIQTANFVVVPKYLMFTKLSSNSLSRKNYQADKKLIYSIQENYYKSFDVSFGSLPKNEEMLISGWREFHFGNPLKAKDFWKNNILVGFREQLALTIAKVGLVNLQNYLALNGIRPRIKYRIEKLSGKNGEIESDFAKLLNAIKVFRD